LIDFEDGVSIGDAAAGEENQVLLLLLLIDNIVVK
jgi:hypothetical protein